MENLAQQKAKNTGASMIESDSWEANKYGWKHKHNKWTKEKV